jgi:hypothetical protein
MTLGLGPQIRSNMIKLSMLTRATALLFVECGEVPSRAWGRPQYKDAGRRPNGAPLATVAPISFFRFSNSNSFEPSL